MTSDIKYLVIFLLKHQNNISWFNPWCLVSFSRERDFLPMLHPFVNMNLQNFSVLTYLLTLTLFAAVLLIYYLTWTKHKKLYLKKLASFTYFCINNLYKPYVYINLDEHITLSIAVCADWLHLLNHPRSQLSDHNSHSSSSACHTFLHGSCLTPLTRMEQLICVISIVITDYHTSYMVSKIILQTIQIMSTIEAHCSKNICA